MHLHQNHVSQRVSNHLRQLDTSSNWNPYHILNVTLFTPRSKLFTQKELLLLQLQVECKEDIAELNQMYFDLYYSLTRKHVENLVVPIYFQWKKKYTKANWHDFSKSFYNQQGKVNLTRLKKIYQKKYKALTSLYKKNQKQLEQAYYFLQNKEKSNTLKKSLIEFEIQMRMEQIYNAYLDMLMQKTIVQASPKGLQELLRIEQNRIYKMIPFLDEYYTNAVSSSTNEVHFSTVIQNVYQSDNFKRMVFDLESSSIAMLFTLPQTQRKVDQYLLELIAYLYLKYEDIPYQNPNMKEIIYNLFQNTKYKSLTKLPYHKS